MKNPNFKKNISHLFEIAGRVMLCILLIPISVLLLLVYIANQLIERRNKK
jgi:hypothetical protein